MTSLLLRPSYHPQDSDPVEMEKAAFQSARDPILGDDTTLEHERGKQCLRRLPEVNGFNLLRC